jgi:hypothetical protein
MSNLQINGAPVVAAGSVMIPPGVQGAISIPGGLINLRFQTEGLEGFHWNHWTLTITAKANPLGVALDVPLATGAGSPLNLSMTIHTVGNGPNFYRIIHYTAYPR